MSNQEKLISHSKIMKYLNEVSNTVYPPVVEDDFAIFTLRKEISIGQGLNTGLLYAVVLFLDTEVERLDVLLRKVSKTKIVPEGETIADIFYIGVRRKSLDANDFDITDPFMCGVMEGREDEFLKMITSKTFVVEKPVKKPDPIKVNNDMNDFIYGCLSMAFNTMFKDPFAASVNICQIIHTGRLRIYTEHNRKIAIIYDISENATDGYKAVAERWVEDLKLSGIKHILVIDICESVLLRLIENKDTSYLTDLSYLRLKKLIDEHEVNFTVVKLTYKDLSKDITIYVEGTREEVKSRIGEWQQSKTTGRNLSGFASSEGLSIERYIPGELAKDYIVDIVDVISVKKNL